MARNIPFFDMFAELQLSGELRLKLAGAEITGAVIDQGKMTISLDLTARTPMSEADAHALESLIRGCLLYTSPGPCSSAWHSPQ